MSTPWAPEPEFFEHPQYAEFLVSLGTKVGDFNLFNTNFQKRIKFEAWLARKEHEENVEDFKNLVPLHIRMNTEEFEWFMSKVAAEDKANIPNLKALEKHRPHGFESLK